MSNEQASANLQMFSAIMNCPHGNLDEIFGVHRQVKDVNPLFYSRFASWYIENGTVRDHKVAFVKTLMEADESQLRDIGWALLQKLPLRLVYQVVYHARKTRSLRSAVKHYLAELSYRRLVSYILRSKKELLYIVRALHIPTDRSSNPNFKLIGEELFKRTGTVRKAFRELREEEDPNRVAEILSKLPVPSYIALTTIKVRTPEILRALIKGMTPNELLQSLNMLGRFRAIKPNMDIIKGKIEAALSDKRVSASRILNILSYLDPAKVPYELFKLLENTIVLKSRNTSKLDVRVSIHIDVSGSMQPAIEAGRMLATALTLACKEPPSVYAVGESPVKVVPVDYSPTGWREAFSLLRTGGWTPLGAGLQLMRMLNDTCDTLVLITDEAENHPPRFVDEYSKLTFKPKVIILGINTGRDSYFRRGLERAGINYERVTIEKVDQYSVDQIVALIGESSPSRVVAEIMSTVPPTRPEYTKKPMYWISSK